MAGTLTQARFYEMYRQRRELPWYINGLADHLIGRGHSKLALQMADHLGKTERMGLAQSIRTRAS